MSTIASYVVERAGDPRTALLFEDRRWSWSEWVEECAARARLMSDLRQPGPFHVGVLLDNVPEFTFWLGGAALAGGVLVGINPTRRGAELERDVTHTDCQLVVTSRTYGGLLEGLDLGAANGRVHDTEDPAYQRAVDDRRGPPARAADGIDERTGYLLLFTSGTTGAPKACWCSQGRLAAISEVVVGRYELTPDDVCYQAMPLFHSNALMTSWGPALVAGAATAMRRRFSASGFLPDVRRFGATYFNYVGKPLSYVLATPERADDADNPLRRVFGNEAAPIDIDRFARRFGCRVDDGYGSTEGVASVSRVPGMPEGALGLGSPGTTVVDPATGEPCPAARFDAAGHLENADEAIGEIVNVQGATSFEGYYNNDDADRARVRDGKYWTGDLGYRDDAGFIYFAGRGQDWLRVDGENIAAAPVERILNRHPDVVLVGVYGVPDPDVGDQCMAALQLRPGASFDGDAFGAWVDAQPDLGPVWAPRFVRVEDELPVTATSKVLKLALRSRRWGGDGVWWRERKDGAYRPFGAADAEALRLRFVERGRESALTG